MNDENTVRLIPFQSDNTCFYALFNQAPDSIFVMDPTMEGSPVIIEANKAACKMHGYTYEEIIGQPITFLDDPETTKHVPARTKRLMDGEVLTFEARHIRKDGSLFDVEVIAQVIQINNQPYILAIDRDITARKEIENLLRDKVTELQEFYDIAIDRELKIKELKEEVERLSFELSNLKLNQ